MPIPRTMARLNRIGLNHVIGRAATRLPGFGVVVHRGRRSGRIYRTPVNVFTAQDGYVIALTYGARTDWVKNVLAADEADLITRNRQIHVVSPRIYDDESRRAAHPIARPFLRMLRVDDFLAVRADGPETP